MLPLEPRVRLGHRARIDQLVLRVCFGPEVNSEAVQVLCALPVCKRELEESVLSLRAEHDELGQSLEVEVFAKEKTLLA